MIEKNSTTIAKIIDRINPEVFFFTGFVLLLIRASWETTMFPQYLQGTLGILYYAVCIGLMLIKTILYDKFSVSELVCFAVMLLIGALSCFCCGSMDPLILMAVVISAKNIDFDKIVKIWLIVSISILLLAFVASMMNLIPNLQYDDMDRFSREVVVRNSFGICFPTDFAAHVFFAILGVFYIRRDSLRWYDFAAGVLIGLIVYYFCRAKLDTGCIFITVLLFAVASTINKYSGKQVRNGMEKAAGVIGTVAVPAAAAVMLLLTYLYEPEGNLQGLDKLITRRLSLGKAGLENYGVELFGQHVTMYGGGGLDPQWDKYNFLDCSYINILVVCGLAFLLLVVSIYIAIGIRHHNNLYLMVTIAIVALNCCIAHHMMEIEYNVFTVALLAIVGIDKTNQETASLVQQRE